MSTTSRRLLIAAIAQVQDAIAQLDEAGVRDLDEYRATLQTLWGRVDEVSPAEHAEI